VRRRGLSAALGVAGGLVLAGATMAAWVREVRVDDVGGVPIESAAVTPGVELAPFALPLGLAASVLGFALLLRSPRVRAPLGVLLLVAGLAALADVVRGILAGLTMLLGLESGAYAALAAALAVVAGGVLALLPAAPPAPALPARYDLDADEADAEWELASVEDDPEVGS
jgi:hypothetical protein